MSETTNLGLFKHDSPATNTNLFDVQRALNDNWDKIDELVGEELEDAKSGFDTLADAINQKIYYFNNVSEMKDSTTLIAGNVIKTLGYYQVNDGGGAEYHVRNKINDDAENGFIIILQNNLVAELIVNDNIVNIRQLGAKGDNIQDTTNIINTFVSSQYSTLFFPQGQYLINDVVTLKSNCNLRGVFNASNINITTTGRIHIGNSDAITTNVQLRDLTIRSNGERSAYSNYAIYFENACLCKIMNCLIRSDNGVNGLNGVYFHLTNNRLHCYDNRIINNQFQRTALRMHKATDNFITDNLLWGNNLTNTAALTLSEGCHNTTIENNHFAVASAGALAISDSCNQLRIINNYFDAQGIGINGNILSEAIISNNIFFHPQQAILLNQLTMSIIANNTFRDCDINDEGYDDIKINTSQGGNSFSGNKHLRSSNFEHTNKAYAYNMPNGSSSYPMTVVDLSTVAFLSFYNAIDTSSTPRNIYVNCYPASLFS